MFTDRQLSLLEFVKTQHGTQVRKYTGEPYYNHCVDVANLVQPFDTEGKFLVEIALCHDLYEDTDCDEHTLAVMLPYFGYTDEEAWFISSSVVHLTDVYTKDFVVLNRKARKEMEALRLSKIEPYLQTVKYADVISNTSSIVEHDVNFAKVYLEEKEYLLSIMNKGEISLYLRCCEIFEKGFQSISI